MIEKLYTNFILPKPKTALLLMGLVIGALGWQAQKMEIDASAETLLLENDQDLAITREINARYGGADFFIVTFSPKGDLLSPESIQTLQSLSEDLVALDRVKEVTSIINVPLLQNSDDDLQDRIKNPPNLLSETVDLARAKEEFLNSPIYRKMLVSEDFKTTGMQVTLQETPRYFELLHQRNDLRDKKKKEGLSTEEAAQFEQVKKDFKTYRDELRQIEHENIIKIRAILDKYRDQGELFLGGANMIADDMVSFIKKDLGIFGVGVLVFLIITLWWIFRQPVWIVLPVTTCAFSVIATSGILGFFGWEVTVISSNFISLQIIITMAITIHLIVRYREEIGKHPDWSQFELVKETVMTMAVPCFYMVVTTMAGFCSLLLSGILPVINFGWMMTAGIGLSLIITFLVFPAVMMLLPKETPNLAFEKQFRLTKRLADLTEKRGKSIVYVSFGLLAFCVVGSTQLMVENSFINYFKESTEIYQGMKVIDQSLGGTTPLDITLEFAALESNLQKEPAEEDEFGDIFDEFEEEFEAKKLEPKYWFTDEKMAEIERVHDYLQNLEYTGKVMSLGTLVKLGRDLNDGETLGSFFTALIYSELPEEYKKVLLDPYLKIEDNQVRFFVRVVDSADDLRRNELLKKIRADLQEHLDLKPERTQMGSLLVLYNNMLQSLFNSQILTLGVVILALMTMFLILFRSLKLSFIAIMPNVLSVGVVLGFMGWARIPLDMMTITIAAISVGIAVDDTIHYIHRFQHEFQKDRDYLATMHRCHESIGYAMYYTSVTIVIGFSILVLSNFIPSIYFGLLTGLAMVIALLAALTLLPRLIILLKPYGPDARQS